MKRTGKYKEMNMSYGLSYRRNLVRIALGLLIAALVIAGCSRNNNAEPAAEELPTLVEVVEVAEEAAAEATDEPTVEPTTEPTEVPTEEPTEEPAAEASDASTASSQPESPLQGEQPDSPLAPPQPESPLAAQETFTAVNLSEPVVIEADVKDGQALVVGTLISDITGEPLYNAVVRFPEVNCPEGEDAASDAEGNDAGEGCFWTLSDAFTPGTVTLEDGSFEVEVEEPGEFMFLVGDMMTVYTFAMVDKDNAYRFEAPADTALDLGEIVVDYQ